MERGWLDELVGRPGPGAYLDDAGTAGGAGGAGGAGVDPAAPGGIAAAADAGAGDELEALRARAAEAEAATARAGDLEQRLIASAAEHQTALSEVREQAATAERLALEHLRRALLAEHRGEVVAELVQGETPQALVASVERAKAAWGAAMEAARAALADQAVPLGNGDRAANAAAAAEGLSALGKISEGLKGRGG